MAGGGEEVQEEEGEKVEASYSGLAPKTCGASFLYEDSEL